LNRAGQHGAVLTAVVAAARDKHNHEERAAAEPGALVQAVVGHHFLHNLLRFFLPHAMQVHRFKPHAGAVGMAEDGAAGLQLVGLLLLLMLLPKPLQFTLQLLRLDALALPLCLVAAALQRLLMRHPLPLLLFCFQQLFLSKPLPLPAQGIFI